MDVAELKRAVRGWLRHFKLRFQLAWFRIPWLRDETLIDSISLIVPCFNVEKYIDELMLSICVQSTGLNNLEIILVDDGATDGTSKRARGWAERLPENVKYVRQDNRGVSGARNAGLSIATGNWVSFPDPDDFLDCRYFHEINETLKVHGRQGHLEMFACNFIRYSDAEQRYKNNHALRYRFKQKRTFVNTTDMGEHIQLSASSCFLRTEHVARFRLQFDPEIVPGFEDAHFVNQYLTRVPEGIAAFLRDSRYYYRKRADGSSIQDTATSKKEYWLTQPRKGWLGLLEDTQEVLGHVPRFIQRTILYDIAGHFRILLDDPHTLDYLTTAERADYVDTIRRVFTFIDSENIQSFEFSSFNEGTKVGVLNRFKSARRDRITLYISDLEPENGLIRLHYFSANKADLLSVVSEGGPVEKKSPHREVKFWLGEKFCYVHSWLGPATADLSFEHPSEEVRTCRLKSMRN